MNEQWMIYAILLGYVALTFGSSLLGKPRDHTPEGYFLAGRSLRILTLFFTLIATNFSAFFFLGFAGEGYRIGYSYYGMMAFGTAFAAVSFYLIGDKAWRLGKSRGYITPVELVGDLSGSRPLQHLYLIIMVGFTFPYLALQPIGAGYILSNLTGGAIPYFWGATALTVFIIFYVFLGGMRSVAATDVKQGLLMIVLMSVAVFWLAKKFGGITEANLAVYAKEPELFSMAGRDGYFNPLRWFSLCLLWLACVPMFPQLFMRFYAARNLRALKSATLLYALIPCFLFLLPVMIGLMGHLSFPGLEGKAADQILPMMLREHTPVWFATLVMTGALAAFMSTLDSQLLALSTIFTRDVYVALLKPRASLGQQVRVGRLLVILFALVGLLIAYRPFDTIFDIAKLAFSGYAALFPVTLALLYWRKHTSATACMLAIAAGESINVAAYLGWIPQAWMLGFEPFFWMMLVEFGILGVRGIKKLPKSRRLREFEKL